MGSYFYIIEKLAALPLDPTAFSEGRYSLSHLAIGGVQPPFDLIREFDGRTTAREADAGR